MQYTVTINQEAFQRVAPELDIIDATIFDFIQKFMATKAIEKKEEEGEFWYWFSWKKIRDELPMINLTTRQSIYNRIEKLIDSKLLKRCPTNQKNAKCYLGQGEYFDLVTWSTCKAKFTPPVKNNLHPPVKQNLHNHNTNKDQSTNDQLYTTEFEEFWDAYDKKVDKRKSAKKWKKLSKSDREAVMEFIPIYKKYQPNPQYRKNPTTFFNNRSWEDEFIKDQIKNGKTRSAENGKHDTEELAKRARNGTKGLQFEEGFIEDA